MTTTAPTTTWRRVSKASPCPICSRVKYCGVSADGVVAICMRTESPRPTKNGGWLHVLTDAPRPAGPIPRPLPVRVPARDFGPLAQQWQRDLGPVRLQASAGSLGVAPEALQLLGCGWNGRAFAFPMFDAQRKIVGIRYRNSRGEKWAEKGGREGVFLPASEPHDPLLIVEGPTDSAAALSLGFDVHGRPSCTGATKITAALTRGRDVVIVLDADDAGRRGGQALASAILPTVASLRVIEPPAKDLRAWLQAGATRQNVLDLIAAAPVRKLRVRFHHG